MIKREWCIVALLFFLVGGMALSPQPAKAQFGDIEELLELIGEFRGLTLEFNLIHKKLLAKAAKDECYFGCGDPENSWSEFGIDSADCIIQGGVPKVNQAYIWSLIKSGHYLWYGTWTNGQCNTGDAQGGQTTPCPEPVPYESWQIAQCESASNMTENPATGQPFASDWRPPKIFMFDILTGVQVEKTLDLPQYARDIVQQVYGFRSAAVHDGVIFFAGAFNLNSQGDLNNQIGVLAFDADTGDFIDATTLTYSDVRKWVVAEGHLYVGLSRWAQGGNLFLYQWDGFVLKWIGNKAAPFQFETVGAFPGAANYMAYHAPEKKIIVGTWGAHAMYYSPDVPDVGGLTGADKDNWQVFFDFADYETEDKMERLFYSGSIESYDGWVYFGSMHILGLATSFLAGFPPPIGYGFDILYAGEVDLVLGSWRAISIWRARNLGTIFQEVELLYGEEQLAAVSENPDYDDGQPKSPANPPLIWEMQPTGWTPKWGKSGFGNFMNLYTWSSSVFGNKLMFGTFDASFALFQEDPDPEKAFEEFLRSQLGEELNSALDPLEVLDIYKILLTVLNYSGGDLWVFVDSGLPAYPESVTGFKNAYNYGFRSIITDNHGLLQGAWWGTANPFNLSDGGGWELWGTSWLDEDGDNVPSETEDFCGPDGNGDHIPDKLQGSVASFPLYDDPEKCITVETCGDCKQILTAASVPEFPDDEGYYYPFGLVSLFISCEEPGGSADVKVYYPEDGIDTCVYRKYGMKGPDYNPLEAAYYNLPGATIGTEEGRPIAQFTLTDGGNGDSTGVDSFIVDPGGPACPERAIPTLNQWGMAALLIIMAAAGTFFFRRRRSEG